MSVRHIAIVLVIAVAVIAYFAWTRPEAPPAALPSMPVPSASPTGGEASTRIAEPPADPGIEWTKPASWSAGAERAMRLATYQVPGAGGAAAAECAVYYFGPGQGGSTQDNINRWIGEFQGPSEPRRSTKKVHGIEVTQVSVKGTYIAHGGMADDEGGLQPDRALLGAIVEGPSGSVFFKLTGPAATVEAASPDFDRMLGSMKKK